MSAFSEDLCEQKHKMEEQARGDLERRVGVLEKSWEDNLVRIYTKFDEVSTGMMKRLPPWVTVVISCLASACTGLAVAFFTARGH